MSTFHESIEYRFFNSRFGECIIARSGQGICSLEFVEGSRSDALQRVESNHPGATHVEGDRQLIDVAASIFEPDIPVRTDLHLSGTDFQIAVWKSLYQIPRGATVSYQAVAAAVGRPRAVRAVANAVASNRLAYLVPCHRVVRSNGGLGGYRWGVALKSALLDWETAETRGTRH
jgi:O-6-methylguanine DNA methyltransferase